MTLTTLRRTTTALLVVVATTAIAAAGLHGSAVDALGAERAAVVIDSDSLSAVDSHRRAGSAVAVAAAPVVTAPATTTTTTTTPVAPAQRAVEAPAPAGAATTAAAPSPAPAPTPTTAPPAPAPAPAPAPTTTAHGTRVSACEANMVRWGNEVRAAHGLSALANDRGIESIPVNWSDGMAGRQQLAHNPRYGEQIFAARPQAVTAGENVGRGTSDRAIFQGFMDSAGHRARIVDRSNTHTTVGCLRDANGILWVTVNFWG